ncbi:MAG: HYR domain-containing protein [Flavobacteriales bacterium]|nr:HYR domain-containing protein [Flavobacteriales bacterium]MBK6945078.1 HYR domain-containing protein [Flavobacteriales bacterium]MBK9535366.1 HYR domain-containing protein [Flavobacteriales bacterium]HQV51459.1 HYR domain-containing protein [Flavobacteriales bacterium]HQX28874.1 HYR domain-containing protein [Flavobacteriales bacterium]
MNSIHIHGSFLCQSGTGSRLLLSSLCIILVLGISLGVCARNSYTTPFAENGKVVSDGEEIFSITCPANISGFASVGNCSASVSVPVPNVLSSSGSYTLTNDFNNTADASDTYPIGVTTVTFSADDGSGAKTCSMTITVLDNQDPVISGCPGNLSIAAGAACNETATWTAPTFSDNCTGGSISTSHAPGSTFSVGTTTVTYTAIDATGNTAMCSFDITVEDNVVPELACPGNISMNNDPGTCSAVVTYTTPVGTDNCASPVTAMVTVGTGSGATFPIGVTPVNYRVDDANGNFTECFFDVTVVDSEAPTITCPADITLDSDPGSCGAVVTYTEPEGVDNCVFALTALATPLGNGDFFPIGTTTVTYDVLDADGNLASCSFSITVNDAENPAITCPSDIVVGNSAGICGAVVNYATLIGTDNCSGTTTSMTSVGTASGSIFPLGTTTVSYETTDGVGLTTSCSFTVTVKDTEAPVATCQNVTIQLDASGNASVTTAQVNNGSTDNCAIDAPSLDVTSFSCANVGANTVTLSVRDGSSNTSICTATVTVEDNIVPEITCPGNITVNNDPGTCGATVTYTTPVGTDNCASPVTTMVTLGTESGATFPIGVTPVSYRVDDANGNFTECFFNITVVDNEVPTIACPADIIVDNDPGSCGAVVTYTEPEGIDNCVFALTALATPLGSGDFFPVGTTTVTYDVLDADGNLASCSFTVIVNDAENPEITYPADIVVGNSAGICGAIVNYAAPFGTDNCPGTTTSMTSVGTASGSTFPLGTTTVSYETTDDVGLTTSCSFTVTVNDTEAPVPICQTASASLNANGWAVFTPVMINNGSTDNCAMASMVVEPDSFNVVGNHDVSLIVFDNVGNTDTCIVSCSVTDNIPPIAVCQNINVFVNGAGSVTITGQQLDGGSTDNGHIASYTASQTNFNCNNLGANNVALIVTDDGGNNDICLSVVTVKDTIRPTVVCRNVTVQLDVTGNDTITAAQINNGSTDNCGVASVALDRTTFTCADVGTNTVILSVTDGSGNTSTCTATVTVQDNSAPSITCPATVFTTTNTGCTATGVPLGAPLLNDNCAGTTTTNNAPVAFPLGNTTVIWTATDANGNTATCSQLVTVTDNEPPVAACQTATIYLNSTGNASIALTDIDGGSMDNCDISSIVASQTVFTCDDIGSNNVDLTVTDDSDNSDVCTAIVTVIDTINPVAICQNITVSLSGNPNIATILDADIDGGSTDNCSQAELTYIASQASFSTIGDYTLTLTVTDASGNASTCDAIVTVIDNSPPDAVCQDTTLFMNSNGTASIIPADLDGGSSDNGAIFDRHASQLAFDCGHFGANSDTLFVTDDSGNTSFCVATVTVIDTISPTPTCQNITVQLDASGTVVLSGTQLDNGSFDNCAITTFALDIYSFNCTNLGVNTVLMTVTDQSGNSNTCSATVTVEDNAAPTAICQNITVQLDATGNASITAADIDNGSNDACGIASIGADMTSFDCTNTGANTVTLTVTDNNGNVSICQSIVTVQDTVAPIAVCQNVTTYLNATGNATINAMDLDNGSSDACGGLTFSASQTTFNCGTTGANNVTLTATDAYGNTATCDATVTAIDTIAPTAICQNVTYTLPNTLNAQVTVMPSQLNNGSTDICTGSTFTISRTVFQHVGTFPDTLFVTDASGNVSYCVSMATINDFTTPIALCNDTTIYLSGAGTSVITANDIDGGSTDNGTIVSMTASQYNFNCSHQGANNVTLIVTDEANNSAFCTAIVTVLDTIAPTAVCQNVSVTLDPSGNASVTGLQIGGLSTDNCGLGNLTLSLSQYTFPNAGVFNVTLTVTDASGNTNSCVATVTVVDNIQPNAVCQPITIYVDATGSASITGNDIDGGSFDNDSLATIIASPNVFNCGNLGANTVVLSVTDMGGNTDDCAAVVTVLDTIAPTVVCQNISIALNSQGIATITSTDVNNGTFDNCSSATLGYAINEDTFTEVGQYSVVLTVTDPSGNSSNCTAVVTVGDDVAPVVLCQPTTIQIDPNGNATITANDIDGGSYDNGVMESLVAGQTVFDCSHLGSNQITLTGTDDQGNMASCIAQVTVLDTITPNVICQDITVFMDFFGSATLTGIQMDGGTLDNCGSGDLVYSSSIEYFSEEGTFEVVLTVTDASGNTSSCTSQVTVKQPVKPLVIPAGFSPNGDGIADTWEIQGLREFPNNTVIVFNRWGNKLFSAAPYLNDWYGQVNEGTLPGDLPTGNYFYILELGDGETRTGYIQLNK